MPKTVINPSYMGLSALYRQNPYNARANALMGRANMQNSGFAAPGLAFVAGRQMAQGNEWEEKRQDLLEQQMSQKEDKADVDAKTKLITLAINAAKQGYPGLGVEILNSNKDIIGLDPEKYVNSLQVDKEKGFIYTGIRSKKDGGEMMVAIGADNKAYKFEGGKAIEMTPEDWNSLGKTAAEKDTRTSTEKEYDRWKQENPGKTFTDFMVFSGKGVDPNAPPEKQKLTGNAWFFNQINEERKAAGQPLMSAEEFVANYVKPKGKKKPLIRTRPDGSTEEVDAEEFFREGNPAPAKTPPAKPAPAQAGPSAADIQAMKDAGVPWDGKSPPTVQQAQAIMKAKARQF